MFTSYRSIMLGGLLIASLISIYLISEGDDELVKNQSKSKNLNSI